MNRAGFYDGAAKISSKIYLLSKYACSFSLILLGSGKISCAILACPFYYPFSRSTNNLVVYKILFIKGIIFKRAINKPMSDSSKTCFYFENFLLKSVFEKNTRLSLKFTWSEPQKWS